MPRHSKGEPSHKKSSSSRSSPLLQSQSHATTPVRRFQALLRRESPSTGWGFLTYKNTWPLCIGSTSSEPGFVVTETAAQKFIDCPAAASMFFSAASASPQGNEAKSGSEHTALMPISALGVSALQKGDVIVGINGVLLSSREQADQLFRISHDKLTLLLERRGGSALTPIVLPHSTAATSATATGLCDLPRPPSSAAPHPALHSDAAGGKRATLLDNLPRPAQTATTPSEVPNAGLSTLPRPALANAESHHVSRFGLPAPPSARTAPTAASLPQSTAQAETTTHATVFHTSLSNEDEEEIQEDRETTTPSSTPRPAQRDSLALLSSPEATARAPASRSGFWRDPLQPVYVCPPHAGTHPDVAQEARDTMTASSSSSQSSDAMGVCLDRLTPAQRQARCAALNHALGPCSAAVTRAKEAADVVDAHTAATTDALDDAEKEHEQEEKEVKSVLSGNALLQVVRRLPVTVRSAVYDRSDCPFTASEGFSEEFHKAVQATVTRLALHREDRLPAPSQKAHQETSESSAMSDVGGQGSGPKAVPTAGELTVVDLLLNGRYDLVLYAQTLTPEPASTTTPHDVLSASRGHDKPNEGEDGDEVVGSSPFSLESTHERIDSLQASFYQVMDAYVAARRSAIAMRTEQTAAAHATARHWVEAFEAFMKKIASPADVSEQSANASATAFTRGGDDSSSKRNRKRLLRRIREHERTREDAGASGGGERQQHQQQAYAAMAQLLTQLQSRGLARSHSRTENRRHHAQPQEQPVYEEGGPRRRLEGDATASGVPTTLDTRNDSAASARVRLYRPPQFPSPPSTTTTTDGSAHATQSAKRENTPSSRFDLPAPPPRRQ